MAPGRRTARRTARRTSRRVAERNQPEAPQAAPTQAAPAPAAPAEADYTDELQKLSAMKDQGVITEQEFEAKKKQILGI